MAKKKLLPVTVLERSVVFALKLTLYDTTVLDKKCSEVCTFLLTGDPPCEFGATMILKVPINIFAKGSSCLFITAFS